MTPEVKKRIEQIRQGIVPEGYVKDKDGIYPRDWASKKIGQWLKLAERSIVLQDEEEYQLVTIRRGFGGVDSRGSFLGKNVLVKNYFIVKTGDFIISKRQIAHGACGIVPPELDGAVVSNEYNVFLPQDGTNIQMFNLMMQLPHYKRLFYLMSDGVHIEKLLFKTQDWMKRTLAMPLLKEQKKIAEILATQDKAIELQARKIEELKRFKKGCLEKMFPRKGQKVPEKRFPGFTDDWEQRKLGDMINVTSVKRIHQSDWTDSGVRFLRARDIVAAAKNEEPDDYLYISKEKYEEYSALSGKVSVSDLLVTGVGTIGVPYLVKNLEPLYFKDGNIIWFQNSDKIDGKFLFYSFSAEQIQGFINESAGIGTVGTYTIESGKKTPISLPNQIEQAKVGEFFQQLDDLITLHQRKLDEMKKQKKALMQLLLTGIVRVRL